MVNADLHNFIARCETTLSHDFDKAPLARQREMYRQYSLVGEGPRPAEVAVSDEKVLAEGYEIPIRVFRPNGERAQPCVIYFHGGGWVFGDLDSHDGITCDLALKANVVVIAVDYRRAPENPFPAALDDSYRVVCAVAQNHEHYDIDPSQVALVGDSAGGNLSAAVSLRARDEGGPELAAQILVYPALCADFSLPAYREEANAPLLSSKEMRYYIDCYLPEEAHRQHPYAAPLLADSYAGLPVAWIVAAEHDPLRDDAQAYAEHLGAAGIPVEIWVAPGLVHGFLRARNISASAAVAFDRLCDAVQRLVSE
jgi:acetyl esterase